MFITVYTNGRARLDVPCSRKPARDSRTGPQLIGIDDEPLHAEAV
jgi:hypothetical protein